MMCEAMRKPLPDKGMVLGIDVGYAPAKKTTCFCTLTWDLTTASLAFCCTTSDSRERAAAVHELVAEVPLLAVAVDGPLAAGLRHVNHYRAAEALLSRGVMQKRGKPGQTSAPIGQQLHRNATSLAKLVRTRCEVARATHREPIVEERIVEAFPNAYLGALIDENDLPILKRDASDRFWDCLVADSDRLVRHIARLLPGRTLSTDLPSVTDHEERAGVVCALTAFSVAMGDHVAVGDPQDGDIILPACSEWGRRNGTDRAWLDLVLRDNLVTVRAGTRDCRSMPTARVHGIG